MADPTPPVLTPSGRTAEEEAFYRALATGSATYDPRARLPRSVNQMMAAGRGFEQPDPTFSDMTLLEQGRLTGARLPQVSNDWSAPGWDPQDFDPKARTGTFFEGLLQGFGETSLGAVLRGWRQKSIFEAENGEIIQEDGYDSFVDPQIDERGERKNMGLYFDSRSRLETRYRIEAKLRREAEQAELSSRRSTFQLGSLAGSQLAPENLLPIGNLAFRTKTAADALIRPVAMWGRNFEGVQLGAFNIGIALASEKVKLAADPSYDAGGVEGLAITLGLPGAIGYSVGLLRGPIIEADSAYRRFRPYGSGAPGTGPLDEGYLPAGAPDRPPPPPPVGTPDVQGLGQRFKSILQSAPGEPFTDEEGVMARSLSAAVGPGAAQQHLTQLLEAEKIKPAWGLEKLGFNPVLRVLGDSMSLVAKRTITELVDLGGLQQIKNAAKGLFETTTVPAESLIAARWKSFELQSLYELEKIWVEIRTGKAPPVGDLQMTGARTAVQDALSGITDKLTVSQFNERAFKAARRGGEDTVTDQWTPAVKSAAGQIRKFYDRYYDEAMSPNVDMFRKAAQKDVEAMTAQLAAATRRGDPPEKLDAIKARIAKLEEAALNGPNLTTAKSYVSRLWDQGQLLDREKEFIDRVARRYFMQTHGMSPDAARKAAREVHRELTRSGYRPVSEQFDEILAAVRDPGGAKLRTFEIPDEMIEDFLINDPIMAIRHHTATMGPAIELTRLYGDPAMASRLARIEEEYAEQIKKAPSAQEAIRLQGQMKQDLEDVATLRDRLLNVAGASKDPHSWDERTIRMTKHGIVWTTMGLSAISQLQDLFRPAMTEGLDAMFRYGFGTLLDDARATIFQMTTKERMLAGDPLELTLATAAMAQANMGDNFMSRTAMEQKAAKATNAFFTLSGMSHAVEFTKRWGGIITIGGLNDEIAQVAAHTLGKGPKPPDAVIERLLKHGIAASDAARMQQLLDQHGIDYKSLKMPNTEAWGDATMQELYRTAFLRRLQQTVTTPGAGDRPTWMSTSIGGLVGMFRTFGASAYTRTLMAGLQEADRNFWMGAGVMVGGAIVLNELRHQLFYGKSSFDQPYLGVLADAVDRSGILGSVMDVNNAMEVASNGKLGMRPLLGVSKHQPQNAARLANTFGGPAAGKAVEAAELIGRVASGDWTAQTWRKMRGFVPGQNLPYVDPVADILFPKSIGGRQKEASS